MSKTQRLFDLIQILRRHRYPVSGKQLAEELNVSLRTVYRDIVTLQGQGASIEGEPGASYGRIFAIFARIKLSIWRS